jgi:hypothetical protein
MIHGGRRGPPIIRNFRISVERFFGNPQSPELQGKS